MPLTPAKCTECGVFVEVDNEKRAGLCQHCNQPFVIEDAIQAFSDHYNISIIPNSNDVDTESALKTDHLENRYTTNGIYQQQDVVIEDGVLKKFERDSEYVVIPNTVKHIDSFAFDCCTCLVSVSIPDSVVTIGSCVFESCENLISINVDENNPQYLSVDGVLFNKDKTTLIQYPAGKTNEEYTIPDGVTSIGEGAFYECKNLKYINIPSTVKGIECCAFKGCTNLTSITIPESITIIEHCVFQGCTSLTSISIPDSVICIGDEAFYECSNLETVNISMDLFLKSKDAFPENFIEGL